MAREIEVYGYFVIIFPLKTGKKPENRIRKS